MEWKVSISLYRKSYQQFGASFIQTRIVLNNPQPFPEDLNSSSVSAQSKANWACTPRTAISVQPTSTSFGTILKEQKCRGKASTGSQPGLQSAFVPKPWSKQTKPHTKHFCLYPASFLWNQTTFCTPLEKKKLHNDGRTWITYLWRGFINN